ncbi:MAG: 50S ribosomal protein L4 [Candidatus Aminicenantales bacterium]
MLKLQVLDKGGKTAHEIELPENVFAYPAKDHLIYEAVINYQANQRRGTAATKTRSLVTGGGKKPWRQKGTGRARAGSSRSPLWRKGATTFGPKPKDYSYDIPKKARRNALKSALALKLKENQILVLQEFALAEAKTKLGSQWLKSLNVDSALVVDRTENKVLFLALRNIPKVKAVDARHLNVFDVLKHKWLVFSEQAFESVMERLK